MKHKWKTLLLGTPHYRVAIITPLVYNAGSCTHVCLLRGGPSKWKNRDGRCYFIVLPVCIEPWLNTQLQRKAISWISWTNIDTIPRLQSSQPSPIFTLHFKMFPIEITWTQPSHNHQKYSISSQNGQNKLLFWFIFLSQLWWYYYIVEDISMNEVGF